MFAKQHPKVPKSVRKSSTPLSFASSARHEPERPDEVLRDAAPRGDSVWAALRPYGPRTDACGTCGHHDGR